MSTGSVLKWSDQITSSPNLAATCHSSKNILTETSLTVLLVFHCNCWCHSGPSCCRQPNKLWLHCKFKNKPRRKRTTSCIEDRVLLSSTSLWTWECCRWVSIQAYRHPCQAGGKTIPHPFMPFVEKPTLMVRGWDILLLCSCSMLHTGCQLKAGFLIFLSSSAIGDKWKASRQVGWFEVSVQVVTRVPYQLREY